MNVLYIIADQHQAACTGYEKHAQAITPNLDRLAGKGTRFSRAYTQNPICTPSRVSILSGQYCHNHGYFGLSGPAPDRLPNFFGHFRAHGYRTAGIGKLHLPNEPVDWITADVDLYAECYESGKRNSYRSLYFEYLDALGLRDQEDSLGLPEFEGRQQHEARPSLLPYEHSVEGWAVQQTQRFIKDCGEQPFCVELSLPRPHQCYTPDQRFWDMYPEDLEPPIGLNQDVSHRSPAFRRVVEQYRANKGLIEPSDFQSWARRVWRGYLACITQVDHAVGQMLDFLDEQGLAEDTIVIYGSDHGAYSGTYGLPEKAPGICSDAVCRVPFLWYVPGVTTAAVENNALVENVDLAPTITSLCGLPAMESVDGLSLVPLLKGEAEAVREVAVTENTWSKALRWKQWRFVHYQMETFGEDTGELYNLAQDPHETRNLYHEPEYQEIVQQCRRHLLEWLIRTTRVKTTWPRPSQTTDYVSASDGKLSNAHPLTNNARPGAWNYL